MGGICPCCRRVVQVASHPVEKPTVTRPSGRPKSSPFSNTGVSKTNPLDLVQGFENEPLVSLEEALESFHGKIGHLSYHIREAKKKCNHSSEDGLTPDESAAIYIYTMRFGNGCLYDHLQDAWKSNQASEMKPWFKYLKLFKSAYDKLPDAKGEIWKGKSYNEELEEELNAKSPSLYAAMDIFSPSKTSVKESLHEHGIKEMILIGFKSVNGKLVRDYAAKKMHAVLVFPGTKLGVSESGVTDGSGSITFHLSGPTVFDELVKKPPTPEKHYVCLNGNCNCSLFH